MAEKNRKIHPHELKNPIVFIAMGFGSGLVPIAPGTAGTLLTVPLVFLLQQQSLLVYTLVTFIVLVTGSWVCGYAANKLKVHDHSGIVYDEVAGFLITMSIVPHGWYWMLAGFVLFRFFDAVKPWPISWLDKNIHGGFGIMLDDVIAGLFSLFFLLLIKQWV
ncbi:MAG: phosphatidylglycerophosphatase A [Gammaproteobacteria bacterium]|nr:MAG: phosphatidylglycerophosphatase A [Gammaproteobacteria bacterium]